MYNPYFPATYQSQYPTLTPQMPQNNYQTNQALNSMILYKVPNESAARTADVAPGNSVMFIHENEPYLFTKTAGRSQLEASVFKKYKIIEVTDEPSQDEQNGSQAAAETQGIDLSEYALKSDLSGFSAGFETLKNEIINLKSEVENLKSKKSGTAALNNLEYEGID